MKDTLHEFGRILILRQPVVWVTIDLECLTLRATLDTIYLHGLKCQSTIGVWPWEKKITQSLVLDIDLFTDISAAAGSDDLNNALDYQALTERVIEFASTNSFNLIETMAERLATLILDEFDVQKVSIKLDKGQAVAQVKHVGVLIERSR